MFQSIQGCRAAAALLVLLFHLGGTVALDRYFGAKSFDTVFAFGDAGVPFFFVLSGFVIMLAHRKDIGQPHRLGAYLGKRIARIYPSYLIVACAVYLVAIAVPSTRDSMPHDIPTLLRSLLLLPQDIAVVGGTGAPILAVARTLQYEVFFYALTGLLILRPSLWLLAVGLVGLIRVWAHVAGPLEFPWSFVGADAPLLFGLGMATAVLARSKLELRRPAFVALLGAVAFLALGALEDITTWRVAHRDLYYGAASGLLMLGLVRAEAAHPTRWRLRHLSLLGNASYALYLIHFPLISVVCKAVHASGLRGTLGASVAAVLCIVLSIVVAVLFHLRVEKPVMRFVASRLDGGRRAAAGRAAPGRGAMASQF